MGSKRHWRSFWIIAVALILLAGAWLRHDYERDILAARERVTLGSRIAQTPCGPIEYAIEGQGEPVLVVHGAGGGFDQGLDIGEPLIKAGFEVIAMSRFGYLRTPLPSDASAEAQADAHACLLDALGIGHTAILGASAGAPSALQFALRYPKRCTALVLLVPALYAPRADGETSVKTPSHLAFLFDTALRSDFVFWLAPRVSRGMVEQSILGTPSKLMQGASHADQVYMAKMIDHILPVTSRRLGLLNDATVIGGLQRYDLERVTVPALAISTADDLYGTYDIARYTAEHIPGARFVGFPSGGHMLIGDQEKVAAEITAFLER